MYPSAVEAPGDDHNNVILLRYMMFMPKEPYTEGSSFHPEYLDMIFLLRYEHHDSLSMPIICCSCNLHASYNRHVVQGDQRDEDCKE